MDLKLSNWFKAQQKINKIDISFVDFPNVKKWTANNNEIFHNSKKFFKIIGVKVKTNFYRKNWDQPIILQKEVGILGILKNIKSNKYLLQAKVEPGNKNKLQFSPTVQATKSNYNQVHGGKKVPYLNYFLNIEKKFIYNQSEQGFRYFNKLNSNKIEINRLENKVKSNSPQVAVQNKQQKRGLLRVRLQAVIRQTLEQRGHRLAVQAGKLHTVSPLATLDRGYAIVSDSGNGKIMANTAGIKSGQHLTTRLSDGEFTSTVTGVKTTPGGKN